MEMKCMAASLMVFDEDRSHAHTQAQRTIGSTASPAVHAATPGRLCGTDRSRTALGRRQTSLTFGTTFRKPHILNECPHLNGLSH